MLDKNEVKILSSAKDVFFSIDDEYSWKIGNEINDFIVDNT